MITLDKVEIVKQDKDGKPYMWIMRGRLARFYTVRDYERFIDEHILELDKNVMPFSGSASVLSHCVQYLQTARNGVSIK